MNDITYKITKEGIHWQEVADVLRRSGLSDRSAKDQETIFTNSYAVVLVYDKGIALDEEYQGYGIGRKLIELLLDQVKGQNVILYTHPRTVALYEKMGFRRNKTAMSIFRGSEDSLNWMKKEGFLLPEKYRFVDEYGRDDMKH